MTESNWAVVERLQDFCAARGHTLLELAFSWLLARPTVSSVIAGATKPEQLEKNVRAGGWALTKEEMTAVDEMTRAV
jgi:aryl-alcohol dehydrogenase-like predicted oxidoreductase